ncbi:uncharacterized protein [Aristolochia californica]|uniref:uncharacterized protein n=1 Tax=Aristolochia californica TaxID=171875 RepID=UPI0035DC9D9C
MAKTNKYSSINFNEIYGPKKPSSSPVAHPPAASHNAPISTARAHGRMLVLTRPSTPHPPPPPVRPQTPPQKPADPSPPFQPESISLRPLGRTDSSSTVSPHPIKDETDHLKLGDKELRDSQPVTLPKPEPFVPPHLRPGFVGREEKIGQDREKQGFRQRDGNFSFGQGHAREGEDGRPKSGGYYEGMNRVGLDSDRNRPCSIGNRPSSGGGSYGSFYRSPPY